MGLTILNESGQMRLCLGTLNHLAQPGLGLSVLYESAQCVSVLSPLVYLRLGPTMLNESVQPLLGLSESNESAAVKSILEAYGGGLDM